MRSHSVTTAELALVASTRAMAGVGLGLLIADKLSWHERRAAGWTLFAAGALLTVPLAMSILSPHKVAFLDHPSPASEDL